LPEWAGKSRQSCILIALAITIVSKYFLRRGAAETKMANGCPLAFRVFRFESAQ